jgi:hypothetical protein
MNLSKKSHLTELRKSIKQAASEGKFERYQTLVSLLNCWKQGGDFLVFAPILGDGTDREVQYLVADAFAYANNESLLPLLMKSAVAPINELYRSTLIWPCGRYDCTRHLDFFVGLLLKCTDPGEAMVACVDVIEAMRGPFEPNIVKRNVRRLLTKNNPATNKAMKVQLELFRTQAAYALLDKYYTQVDKQWKTTAYSS